MLEFVDAVKDFPTKRFIYNTIEKKILNNPGCSCIVGARKIGKTVLLKQLEGNNKSNSFFIDASTLKYSTDFELLYKDLYNKGIRNIFIDEICKINEDLLADFVSVTRYYAGKVCFILSGSVSISVKNICRDIGRGEEYELPPIMYIERLCWEHGFTDISIDAIKSLSSYDLYISYIKTQNTLNDKQCLYYITDVVADTLRSYLRGTYLGDNKMNMSEKEIYEAIKYISLCQFVYKSIKGNDTRENYVSIPRLSKEIQDYIGGSYRLAKKKWDLSKEEIGYVLSLLYGCGLAKQVSIYRGSKLDAENLSLDSNYVDACVFEYPWLSSLFFSTKLQNDSDFMAIWVENSVLLRESYIYSFYDKYRDKPGREIDTIYKVDNGGFYGLEVKDRKSSNVQRSYISQLVNFAVNSLGLEDIYLTCSDDPKDNNRYKDKFLRIDKVIASMELEYMFLVDNGELYSDLSIDKLIEKYFS